MKEPSSSRSSSWRGRAVLRHDYKLVFRPALARALVAVIALTGGKHQAPVSSVSEIMISNGFFVALWLGSAGCSGLPRGSNVLGRGITEHDAAQDLRDGCGLRPLERE